ncbi:MAG: hypothetical protein ACK40C_00725 [Novosphingobium meiothermophilum]
MHKRSICALLACLLGSAAHAARPDEDMGSRQPAPPAKATRAANDTCGFSGVLPQIGQPLTPQMQAEMLRAKGPAKLRLIRPGMVIAQDFQPVRTPGIKGATDRPVAPD